MTRAVPPVLLVLTVLAPSRSALADRYAHGLYAEMGVGATGFVGSSADHAAVGPTLGVRVGYEPFSWLSLGVLALASTHEATVPPPPDQEYFQLYAGGADVRLAVRIGRVALFAEGAAGLAAISTNVLDKVEITKPAQHRGSMFQAGGGLDYHIQNRHFSLGLAGDWGIFPDFAAAQAVTVRLYLRYSR